MHETLDAKLPCHLKQDKGSDDVRLNDRGGLVDAPVHMGLGREMDNSVASAHCRFHCKCIANVTPDKPIVRILGDRIEVSLRRALIISDGDYWALLQGAASRVIVGAALLLLVLQSTAWMLGFRKKMLAAAAEEQPPPRA